MHAERQRRLEAMGLGPLWVLRSPAPSVEAPDPVGIAGEDIRPAAFGSGSDDPAWVVLADRAIDDPHAQRLLGAMLAAVGLDRVRDVFVADVEVAADGAQARRWIATLAPRLVLVMGEKAASVVLGDAGRGRIHALDLDGVTVPAVATFHPAHLLREPQDKAGAWVDLCLARRVLANA